MNLQQNIIQPNCFCNNNVFCNDGSDNSPFKEGLLNASIKKINIGSSMPDKKSNLVAVIISIRDGASYDELFTKVEQKVAVGNHVHSYLVTNFDPNTLLEILKKDPDENPNILRDWGKDSFQMFKDISSVDPSSVVFNWECCGGCSSRGFANGISATPLISYLLKEKSFMVMCSDFSLKALIKEWDERLLGANPLVDVGNFSSKVTLRFDSNNLKRCESSAQLQMLGELCEEGKVEVDAMASTIAFAIDQRVRANNHPKSCRDGWQSVEVLTIATQLGFEMPTSFTSEKSLLSSIGKYSGLVGHCIIHYPSGGRLLLACPHWVELSQIDVEFEQLNKVSNERYGLLETSTLKDELASITTTKAKKIYMRSKAIQFIQQTVPSTYSSTYQSPKKM